MGWIKRQRLTFSFVLFSFSQLIYERCRRKMGGSGVLCDIAITVGLHAIN